MQMKKQRKSIRLKNYDYSQSGFYYVTICSQNRQCLFGDVVNGKMVVNEFGQIINDVFKSLPKHHRVNLDVYQIMPNHIHFILIIPYCRGFARKTPTFGNVTSGSLPCVIRAFKSETTKQIRQFINNPELIVWQRNYYEHIIRNETDLNKICEYIKINPKIWDRDRNNPKNI
jgi:REP element-mobilizing transposase RayT